MNWSRERLRFKNPPAYQQLQLEEEAAQEKKKKQAEDRNWLIGTVLGFGVVLVILLGIASCQHP
jgi:hypothetical protein